MKNLLQNVRNILDTTECGPRYYGFSMFCFDYKRLTVMFDISQDLAQIEINTAACFDIAYYQIGFALINE